MLNIHQVDRTTQDISNAPESISNGIVLSDGYITKFGNKISQYGIEGLIRCQEFEQDILAYGYSDEIEGVIVICRDGIYKMGDELEQIIPASETIHYGEVAPGGAHAIYAENGVVYGIDTSSGVNQKLFEVTEPIVASRFRRDCAFVAVATQSQIFTYTPKGELHGKLDQEGIVSITWNPLGSWIAAATGTRIEFLEKNCCRRQAIDIGNPIVSVEWSEDDDVLSVVDQNGTVYIYTQKNRVFYSKCQFHTDCLPKMFWSKPLVMAMLSQDGQVETTYFNHVVDNDVENVYVINGPVLQISHWTKGIIPPPLCHEKVDFGSQINCVASNDGELAVLTLDSLHIPSKGIVHDLPAVPQCAKYVNNQLYFGCGNCLFTFENGEISLVKELPYFVGFITNDLSDFNSDGVYNLIQTGGKTIIHKHDGNLLIDGNLESTNVYSAFADGNLIAYTHDISKLHISYEGNHADRDIEWYTHIVFFARHIFSIVYQMQRGNIETVAPHVVVEARLRTLIQESDFKEALRISKRYMVPFSRLISLGNVSIDALTSQISDSSLRPFISTLKPSTSETDRQFLISLLSFLFGNNVEINQKIELPTDIPKLASEFFSVICIALVLLDSPSAAVLYACSIGNPEISKQAVNFLLTLYDNDRLFDYALKTYSTRTAATVGMLTMREPSSYIPLLEDLQSMPEEQMKATIDEMTGDFGSALVHFSKCGPSFEDKCVEIAGREKLFEEGLSLFEEHSSAWNRIIALQVADLSKDKSNNKKRLELATAAVRSSSKDLILENIEAVVDAGLATLAAPFVGQENLHRIKDALVKRGKKADAARFAADEMSDRKEASKLFMEVGDWYSAIQFGADRSEAANKGLAKLLKEFAQISREAASLKEKFGQIAEAQKVHPEASRRKGARKERRGLPPIVARLQSMLPSTAKMEEVSQVRALLDLAGRHEDSEQLAVALRSAVRAVWPIPHLPDNEEMIVPEHLKGIL